jgi:triosephosphate isomerase (TIM)
MNSLSAKKIEGLNETSALRNHSNSTPIISKILISIIVDKNFIDQTGSFIYHVFMKRLIIANWKMNGSLHLIHEFHSIQGKQGTTLVVCPPSCYLSLLQSAPVSLGSQNCHNETYGAFTGEISAAQLNELGCTHVILGHSERRTQQQETDDIINKKAHQAIEYRLIPVICIGETLEERQQNRFEQALLSQIDRSTHLIPTDEYVIAYEPVWSIGTGLTPTVNVIQDMITLIRKRLGDNVTIIYGGSVNDKNALSLAEIPHLNGVLVGGASLSVTKFQSIVDAFQS